MELLACASCSCFFSMANNMRGLCLDTDRKHYQIACSVNLRFTILQLIILRMKLLDCNKLHPTLFVTLFQRNYINQHNSDDDSMNMTQVKVSYMMIVG